MGKGSKVQILSVYKEHFSINNGNLLCVIPQSKRLCFNETESTNYTNFVRTNKRGTCTLQITIDGTSYYISEQSNRVYLKEKKDSSCIFKVIPKNGQDLIKANASGRYLTTDEYGGIITTAAIKESSPPSEALYKFLPGSEVINNNNVNIINMYETAI